MDDMARRAAMPDEDWHKNPERWKVCRHCKQVMYRAADECPHCGKTQKRFRWDILAWSLLAAVVLGPVLFGYPICVIYQV